MLICINLTFIFFPIKKNITRIHQVKVTETQFSYCINLSSFSFADFISIDQVFYFACEFISFFAHIFFLQSILMEDYAELEPNPSNELACYLYFYEDESLDDKSKSKKDTGHEDSQNQHPVEKPDSGKLQQQKFMSQAIRSRGIIQVGENIKSKYISTKKGTASQTNVLAINSKTFLKKMILKKFQNDELSISSAQKEFLSSKANLENFKIFFHQSHEFLCDKSEDDDKNKDSQKFRDFCEEQLCQSMTIKKIFHSKKMNLKNKLIMIKYLECLKNGCLNPDRFSNWKGLHHINLKN